jgi:hypothetical protein
MAQKPLPCRLGVHSYVRRHSEDEQYHGPDQQVCRRCGKTRGVPFADVPPGVLGGGPGGAAG